MKPSASETCRKIADLIERNPALLDMSDWQYEDRCGTVACVAGHIGLLHADAYTDAVKDAETMEETAWLSRQAARIGLNLQAGIAFFYDGHDIDAELVPAILRSIAEASLSRSRPIGEKLFNEIREANSVRQRNLLAVSATSNLAARKHPS